MIEIFAQSFMLKALLAGLAIAVIAGAMGCFVVWRRMAYFGDSLSHSALLGIALGLATGIGLNLGIIIICLAFACLLIWFQRQSILATDTVLGILAHSSLSIGMVSISLLNIRFNLHGYLFGDILAVTQQELLWIYAGGALILALLIWQWSSFVLMTLNEDLARADGININIGQIMFMLLMTLVVALSVRIVGILLITSLLIIPAATARPLARSPEAMAVIACVIAMIAVFIGLIFSYQFDAPSGPSIVASLAVLFIVLLPFGTLKERG